MHTKLLFFSLCALLFLPALTLADVEWSITIENQSNHEFSIKTDSKQCWNPQHSVIVPAKSSVVYHSTMESEESCRSSSVRYLHVALTGLSADVPHFNLVGNGTANSNLNGELVLGVETDAKRAPAVIVPQVHLNLQEVCVKSDIFSKYCHQEYKIFGVVTSKIIITPDGKTTEAGSPVFYKP